MIYPSHVFQSELGMSSLSIRYCLAILLSALLGLLDQFSDLNLVIRLMSGPDQDTHLNTGQMFSLFLLLIIFFPSVNGFPILQSFNVTFKEQPPHMKQ